MAASLQDCSKAGQAPGTPPMALSPFQIEKATFKPRDNQTWTWVNQLSNSILEKAVSGLEDRMAKQETRIMELECEVKQCRIEGIVSSAGSCTEGVQPHRVSFSEFPEYCYPSGLEQHCLAPPPTPRQHIPPAPDTLSSFSSTAPYLSSSETRNSLANSSGDMPLVGDMNPAPTHKGEVTMPPNSKQSPYLFEDLVAFESILHTRNRKPITVTAEPGNEVTKTLLEGVGSVDELTHHGVARNKDHGYNNQNDVCNSSLDQSFPTFCRADNFLSLRKAV